MNNIERLKKVQAIARQLKAKDKKLSHLEAVKKAWKQIGSLHKDTKSHNVNIKVVSGVKKAAPKKSARSKAAKKAARTRTINRANTLMAYEMMDYNEKPIRTIKKAKKALGALPVGLTGSFWGWKFKVINQFTIDGGVTAQVIDLLIGDIVGELNGRPEDITKARNEIYSRAYVYGFDNDIALKKLLERSKKVIRKGRTYVKDDKDLNKAIDDLKRRILKFLEQLNLEVKKYNRSKNKTTKSGSSKPLVYSPTVKKLSVIEQIKTILKADHKRLKYGYKTVPGNPILKQAASLGAYFDTTVIKDLDALKKEYFKLAKKYHPDAGGTTVQFQELGAEYEKLVKKLLSGSKLSEEQQKNEFEIDETLRKIIDQIIVLPGINIEVIGKWIWVSGLTYPVRQQLKSAGLVFIKKAGVPYWVYKGVESAGRGKLSIDEIKQKYGTHTPDKKDKGKYLGSIPRKFNKASFKMRLIKLKRLIDKRYI